MPKQFSETAESKQSEFKTMVEEVKARTHIIRIPNRDDSVDWLAAQDWRVTLFHCVVGPVQAEHLEELADLWHAVGLDLLKVFQSPSTQVESHILHIDPFMYVTDFRDFMVCRRREVGGGAFLFYTNNPLIVNEMQLGEVSLAVVENNKVILTNFVDLPGIENAMKIYKLGECWLNYAEGGTEQRLRFGKVTI